MYAAQSETMFFALRCICFYCCRVKRFKQQTLYPTVIMLFCVLPDNNKLLCINFAPNMLRLAHFHFVQVRRLGNKNESFKNFVLYCARLAHFHFVQVRRRLGNKNESFKTFVLYCARLALTLPLDYKTIYEFNSRHWQFLCQSRRVRWRQYGDAQTAGRRPGQQHCHDSRRI